MKSLKPKIGSVSFHHHGKEFAITVTGENLWFCYQVKVGSVEQAIEAENASQKSVQFNFDAEDNPNFSGSVDHINVKVWNHFASPVRNGSVKVKHKVGN